MKNVYKRNMFVISCLIFMIITLFTSCTTTTYNVSQDGMGKSTTSPPLRVGISTNAPPFAFKQGGKLQGLDVDVAL